MIKGGSGCYGFGIIWRNSPGHQFIGGLGGGAQFGRAVQAAGDREEPWLSGFVSSTLAVIPAINGESLRLTAMRWRGLDTRRTTAMA
jgi:hypothetical protein